MKNDIQIQLGKKIQRYRKIRGLSQEKFAELIGIATNTLSSIETGKAFMTAQTLEKITQVLCVTLSELFEFPAKKQNTDIYKQILKKLELIKHDKERLNILYKLINSLL